MKFLFRSGWGESLAIARRVESEGNLVRLSIVEPTAQQVGQGLITKTRDYPGSVAWADVVVFDSNPFAMAKEAERVREAKKPCIGSSQLAGELEHDRLFAADVAKKAGLHTAEFKRFKGRGAWNKARDYLSEPENDGTWVWKANGDGDTVSTYVADDVPEMLRMLNYFEELYIKDKDKPEVDFMLCERISGKEISTEAWFNGKDFYLPNNTLEKNRLFPGDLGEKTGCAGNVVWTYPTLDDCMLFNHLLKPLAKVLEGKYNGPIDVNALIEDGDEEGSEENTPMFLEFTPRFGYDAIFTLAQLVRSDFGGLLADVAMGSSWNGKYTSDRFAGGLRLHISPYPNEEKGVAQGAPIFGFEPDKIQPGVWPIEVMMGDDGEPV